MNAEAKASPQLRGCIDNIFKLNFLLFHPSTSTAIEARRKNKKILMSHYLFDNFFMIRYWKTTKTVYIVL